MEEVKLSKVRYDLFRSRLNPDCEMIGEWFEFGGVRFILDEPKEERFVTYTVEDLLDSEPKEEPADLNWLLSNPDAMKWADEYCKLNKSADHGTTLAWFANAIMCGYDTAIRDKGGYQCEVISPVDCRLESLENHVKALQDTVKRLSDEVAGLLKNAQDKHRH